jgi:hypothetical protein
MKIVAVCGALLMLTGCASIISRTSQEVVVNTNPPGANCSLIRKGVSIARVNPTPGAATIKKTKHDITISCAKVGYQTATYMDHSGVAGSTFGNIVAGGLVGWGIDSASGADNKYESPVNISMVPVPPAPVATPTPAPPAPAATNSPPPSGYTGS